MDVAAEFGASITKATGLRTTSIPVRQRPGYLPQYVLMLFSKDHQAHWDFADVASKAHVDWLHHCDSDDYNAFIRQEEEAGVMPLFGPDVPDISKLDAHLRAEAAAYLVPHLTNLIRTRGWLRPIDAIEEGYGDMLGRARVTHYRAALVTLHKSGVINDDGKGDFWKRTIRWSGS